MAEPDQLLGDALGFPVATALTRFVGLAGLLAPLPFGLR